MATVDQLQVLITANAAQFEKQMQGVQKQLNAVSQNTSKMSSQASAAFSKMKIAAAAAAVAIGAMVVKSTKEFGNFEQNVGGAKAIFGEYAGFVQKKALEAANSMGMSMNQYMQTVNKIGAIMQGTGMDAKTSLALTSDWMQRAADQASVMGVTTETAMDAITAAAKGNFMLMDNIGVKMTQANIQAYALANGLATAGQEMTEAQKVAAAYAMFMDRTSYAAGNFAREGATTLNGALATLKANFANLGAMLGSAFAPTVQAVALAINNYLIPVLQAVIPYIIGFMNVIGQMVSFVGSALSSLFGGGAKKANTMKVSANAAAASVGSVGSAAIGAGDALGGAAKQAKKLKGQLAGFDEMNVLTEPETGSGGGGGGAGGGGGGGASAPAIDMSGFENFNPFGDMEAKASEVAGKLKKIFDDFLSGFDFAKITAAFSQFWDDVKAFLEPAGKIISDVWHNYIKPMLYWAGNFLLPAALNALGGAIRFVGQVGGAVWDVFLKPFVDAFLVPVAKWTGGKIVKILNNIGDALRDLSKNEAVVKGLANALSALAIVFAGFKIAGFVSAMDNFAKTIAAAKGVASGLTPALAQIGANALTSGQKISVLAGFFGAPLINALGLAKAAFSGLWTMISANPIGAIIAIVGALLLTNEDLRNALMELISGVLASLSGVLGSIMNILQGVINVLMPIIEVIGGVLVDAINILAEILTPLFEAILTPIKAVLDGIGGAINAIAGFLGIETEKTKENTETKEEAKRKAEELHAALSEEMQQIDENKNGVIEYDEALKHLNDTRLGLVNSKIAVINAQEEVRKKTAELKALAEKYGVSVQSLTQDVNNNTNSHHLSKEQLEKAQLAVWGLEKANLLLDDAVQKEKSATDANNESLKAAKQKYNEVTNEGKAFLSQTKDTEGFMKQYSGKINEARETIKKLGGSLKDTPSASQVAEKALNGMAEKTKSNFKLLPPNASAAGKDSVIGFANGINDNISFAENAAISLATRTNSALRNNLQINSPSRLTAQAGGFFTEGFASGISGKAKQAINAARELGDQVMATISAPLPNISQNMHDMFAAAQKDFDTDISSDIVNAVNASYTPEITVKIGEEKILDRVVSGINDMSFLRNQSVINI